MMTNQFPIKNLTQFYHSYNIIIILMKNIYEKCKIFMISFNISGVKLYWELNSYLFILLDEESLRTNYYVVITINNK